MGNTPKVLMILTSHRLDCLKLCMGLLFHGGSVRRFDHVVLLLNGVVGRHLGWINRLMAAHPDIPWETIAGPRGRGERISSLQNECVRRHPAALYFKIDEDTFVSADWDERMLEAYEYHRHDPSLSLITPVIPNNGLGCHCLLQRFPDLRAEYERRFQAPISPACDGPVWINPRIAEWIMRRFLNLADANAGLRAQRTSGQGPEHFSFRFSINCILYDYRHWQEIGGVPKEDEVGWGDWIPKHNKYAALVTDALVHHYSFFVQQDWLDRTNLLEDLWEANLGTRINPLVRLVNRLVRTSRQIPRICRQRLTR